MPSEHTASYAGRFSDGKTAATEPVEVRLSSRGVEIERRGREPALTWPYGTLSAASLLSQGQGDVLLSYAYMPGATLFVADPRFAAALVRAAPQLSASAQRWRWARPMLAVGAAILLIAAGIWALELSPARTLAQLMPDSVRQSLGRQVMQSLAGSRKICDAPAGRAALARLTERLSAATGRSTKFMVHVLDWRLLNAFAAPGEQIVLTRELVERAGSPDEVAGVLAHEMGHGLELHPESGIIRAVGLSAAIELMLGGGGGTLTNIGLMLTQLSYTRAAEREADAHALQILERAGISPKGIADFFKRVEQIEGRSGAGGIDLLRTHPQSDERARTAAARPSYLATPALEEADWQALRIICGPAPKGNLPPAR